MRTRLETSGLNLALVALLVISTGILAVPLAASSEAASIPRSQNIALVPNQFGRFNFGGTLPTGGFPDGYAPSFTSISPESIRDEAANPIASGLDTIVLNGICDISSFLDNAQFKSRIENFVRTGGKLVIWDSECTSTDYSKFALPFTSNNPGALGATGTLTDVEDNSLSSSNPASPSFIDVAAVANFTDAVGDANVFTTFDPGWFVDLRATNVNGITGPVQTYANLGNGLVIYSGLDKDEMSGSDFDPALGNGPSHLNRIWLLELLQPWDPDNLPHANPVIGGGRLRVSEANEPAVAVNPKNSNNIIVGYNSHDDNQNTIRCGYSTTFDGGLTWTRGVLSAAPGVPQPLGDPSVTFAPDGKAYFACLAASDADPFSAEEEAIIVSTSTNGGKTFGPGNVAVKGRPNSPYPVFIDQESIAASPTGNGIHLCYTLYDKPAGKDRYAIWSAHSLNNSGPWTKSIVANTRGESALGCSVTVTGKGRVWVGYWNKTTSRAHAAYSDNGSTFIQTTLGSKIGHEECGSDESEVPGRHVLLSAEPTIGSNRVMGAWAHEAANGHTLVRSTWTDGTEWKKPVQTSTADTVEIFQPALSWGRDGKIALGFYEKAARSLTYNISSTTNPSQPFAAPKTVATGPSNLCNSLKPFERFGDYTAVVRLDGSTFAAWTDNRSGRSEVLGVRLTD